jgi:SPX domain protein involved in polyphosphate accumulation
MKRSEMIRRLQKKFYFDSEDIADLADEIIDFLVSQGMQPPKRIKYAPTAYAEPNKKIVYEWEDEE